MILDPVLHVTPGTVLLVVKLEAVIVTGTDDKPGIRAQLYDVSRKELASDFIVETGEDSIHILNAVSPAWTSSFPFADWVVENYILT